jgi:hypothetical protein
MLMDDEALPGGVTNAGNFVRAGQHVKRPLPPNATTPHALLRFFARDVHDQRNREVPGSMPAGRMCGSIPITTRLMLSMRSPPPPMAP